MYACMYVCVYVCMHVCMYVCVNMYVCCVCARARARAIVLVRRLAGGSIEYKMVMSYATYSGFDETECFYVHLLRIHGRDQVAQA